MRSMAWFIVIPSCLKGKKVKITCLVTLNYEVSNQIKLEYDNKYANILLSDKSTDEDDTKMHHIYEANGTLDILHCNGIWRWWFSQIRVLFMRCLAFCIKETMENTYPWIQNIDAEKWT